MLLAPGRPVLANVGFGALLEGGQSDLDFYGFRFPARRGFLLYDVEARGAAIAFDAKTRCVAGKARILWRHILERAQAEPALLTALTVSINPIPRRRALHDKVETIAVEIFTGPRLTFDVERPELARHVVLQTKPSSEPTAKTHGSRGD